MSDKTPINKTKSLIEAANRVTNNLQEDCGCGCGGNSDPILSLDEDTQKFIESMELNESQQALLNEKMTVLNEKAAPQDSPLRSKSDIQAEINDLLLFIARCEAGITDCSLEQLQAWKERLKKLRELCPKCDFDEPNPHDPGITSLPGGKGISNVQMPKQQPPQMDRGMSL